MPNQENLFHWFIPSQFSLEEEEEEEEERPDFSENLPIDLKDFRKKVQLVQMDDGMCIHVVAINIKNPELNNVRSIPAYTGEALNVGVYDLVKDNYCIECESYHELGSIPVNYKLWVKGAYSWMIDVPLPLSIIERYLSERQKENFGNWKLGLGNLKDYTLDTIQVVDVY